MISRSMLQCAVMCMALASVSRGGLAQRIVAGAAADDADVRAATEQLLARHVTVDIDRATLSRAIDTLSARSGVRIQYAQETVEQYPSPVSLHVRNASVKSVIEHLLARTTLRVVPLTRSSIGLIEATLVQDSVRQTITGRVVDSLTGRGISGATVKVQGSKVSAITSDSGRFWLRDIPTGDRVLSIRVFGYRPVTRPVIVTSIEPLVVRVLLAAAPNVLSGVVTTATGRQRKVEVGNDITTLNVDSIRQTAPITSVTDLLEARVPGMTVLHSSGAPGDPSRVRLRGAGSINENNDPIVIVDGIRVYAAQSDARNKNLATGSAATGVLATFAAPSPLDQIDPASIATIEVFKGPSAAALYGADAGNGVIVITTKKGQAGPTHWSANLGAGINYVPGTWPINYYRFGYGASSGDTQFCAWNDLTCAQDSVVAFQALNDSRTTLFASHGGNQQADVTVSGASGSILYSFTASGTGDQGMLKLPDVDRQRYEKFYNKSPDAWMVRPDKYTTYGGNGQMTVQPTRTLQATVTSSLFQSAQQRSNLESGIARVQSTYFFADQLGVEPTVANAFTRITSQSLSWTNGLSMSWQPYSWLPLTSAAGLNSISTTAETMLPYGVVGSVMGDTLGHYSVGRGNSLVKTMNIGSVLPIASGRVATAVGFNFNSQSTADLSAGTSQLAPGVNRPAEFPQTCLINGVSSPCSHFAQSTVATSTYGWYVEPRLNLLSRFFLSPGFRLDGGSASGANAGLTAFPKIDLSYIAVNREGERPLGGVLTLFRPRIAFGYAGVQPGPADKLRLFDPNCGTCDNQPVSLDGTTYVRTVFLSTLGNTLLRPERSSELEVGFDADLWNDRVQFVGTQYNKIRHDAIQSLPVAPSVYGDSRNQFVNIGVIRNSGTELQLNTRILESRAFGWDLNAHWSHNSGRVVRLNPGFRANYDIGVVPGYPLFGRWAKPILSFADVNGDGIISTNEVRVGDSSVYVGQQSPKYLMTFNTGVTLAGRLRITTTVSYQNGLNQFNAGLASDKGGFVLLPNQPGTSLATQAAVAASSNINSTYSTQIGLMQTVNELRWRTLSVSYEIPSAISQAVRIPYLSVALQGSNLGLHSNYRGKDPNVNAFSVVSGNGDQTRDTGQLPQPRTWVLMFTLRN